MRNHVSQVPAAMNESPDRRAGLPARVGALAFFVLLSIVVTWPLTIHLFSRVPGWYVADNYEYVWKLWWFKHALVDLGTNPLVAPDILYPSGFALAHAEITPLHTIFGLPITLLLGEIASYNIFALASFVLAGWATFLILFRWTGRVAPSLLAGILFTLNPYHVVRYGGILPLMAIQGLPIFLLGVEGWIASRRLRWIALAGLGYGLCAWASIYYAFGMLLLGPIYIGARLGRLPFHRLDRRTLLQLGYLGLLVLVCVVPVVLPYLQLGSAIDLRIPLQETDFWSASPTDYILPSGIHPIWGSWVLGTLLGVPADFPQVGLEFVLGTGFVSLLFAFYGARQSPGGQRAPLVVFTLIAFILSLGTRLHIGRHPLILPAPESLVAAFNRAMNSLGAWLPAHEAYQPLAENGLTLPLPALLLRWLIPPLTGMRAWNRFAAFFSLGLSLLAGLGMAAWSDTELRQKASGASPRRREIAAGIVVIALAVFELVPRAIPLQVVGPRPIDGWLARQAVKGSIMELPLTSALSAPQMLYTRYHGWPIAFAYGTYLPYWYREQFPELERCPEEKCLDRLRSWDVTYILLNLADTPAGPALERLLDLSGDLVRTTRVGDYVVYRLLE